SRSGEGIWYLVTEPFYIHSLISTGTSTPSGCRTSNGQRERAPRTTGRSPGSSSPYRRPTRARREQGRNSMSQRHMSEKNEKSLQEHGISGPQVREHAAKQFLNLSALAVREKAI